jgi:hypothetical protein
MTIQMRPYYFRGLSRFANEIPLASAALRSSPALFKASIFSGVGLRASRGWLGGWAVVPHTRSALIAQPPKLLQLQHPNHVWSGQWPWRLGIEIAVARRLATIRSVEFITPVIAPKVPTASVEHGLFLQLDGSRRELAQPH